MPLGKQARVLTDAQQRAAVRHVAETSRYPERDRVVLMLSYRAGLRVKEMSGLLWRMVRDGAGAIGDSITLENSASKGKRGGRIIPMHADLRSALTALAALYPGAGADTPVLRSQRGGSPSANTLAAWFSALYGELGMDGCSSHSGRRTMITQAARKIVLAGGSLRDVQGLAGHANIGTTQRYIDESEDAKRRVIDML